MSLTKNSNQVFLPGGATNSQNSPYISVWPLDHIMYLHPICYCEAGSRLESYFYTKNIEASPVFYSIGKITCNCILHV